ncbi:MAG: hypothetical protein CMQ84_03590 [Gammaproteobacteria bacterium]|nr:hypothetical protein [Gammaproteobacteria bacterium]OUX78655.1 MAG: hypothetical protein CBC19_04325 [Oceanospirillales bacterium TMED59]
MGSEQPLMRMDSATTGRCRQCALHTLCLPGIVGFLKSTLSSLVADDITFPKGQTLYGHDDTASNLYVVKSGGFKIMTPLCGHDAHISGFRMPGDLVGACGLTGDHYAFTAQALSRSTVYRLPFDRRREAQLRQPVLAQGLLQAIAHQAAQAQRQITRTNLPALARFGLLILDISTHHKKRNLSGTEFELPVPRTDIADSLALELETLRRLISSLTKRQILMFKGKTVRILDHHALEHACEVLN